MTKQDEYRRNAEHAQQMAERVASEEDKTSWLNVASGWLSLLAHRPPANGKEHFGDQAQAFKTGRQSSTPR